MNAISIIKYDSRVDIHTLKGAYIKEVYKKAILLEKNNNLITLLRNDKRVLPGSLVIDRNDMSSISSNIKPKFDFSYACSWDSVLKLSKIKPSIRSMNYLKKCLPKKTDDYNFEDTIKDNTLDSILGKGPGLTPAADDFIIGILNTAVVFNPEFFNIIAEGIKNQLHRTSRLSSHYIKMALQKRAGEDISDLLKALAVYNKKEISKQVGALLDYGASSGFYTLKGILWALQKI